jgi:chorismate synthase
LRGRRLSAGPGDFRRRHPAELDRRKPGTSRHVTQRRESDTVEILSGVFEGRTTGTPIGLLIRNEDQRSKDYGNIAETFRPGHADYTYWQKYGIRDHRGGGRVVGARNRGARRRRRHRPQVAAPALRRDGARLDEPAGRDRDSLAGRGGDRCQSLLCAERRSRAKLEAYMDALRKSGDSVGAEVTVVARGVPVGWGDPVYDRLDADIAYAMMGINAVKGVEIGAGFASVAQKGSEHGDELTPEGFLGNNAGGILGGISTGQEVVVRMAVKPTSSIRLPRRTINLAGEPAIIETHGRHDPCVGIRATPIAEAMLALVLIDAALHHRAQCADVDMSDAGDSGQGAGRRLIEFAA